MWIRIFNSQNHQIRQIGIEHSIVRIIRLLGIRIEYLIVGMIGLWCRSLKHHHLCAAAKSAGGPNLIFKSFVKNNPSIGSLPNVKRNILAQGMNFLSISEGYRH
jgi:hypothetical protein